MLPPRWKIGRVLGRASISYPHEIILHVGIHNDFICAGHSNDFLYYDTTSSKLDLLL